MPTDMREAYRRIDGYLTKEIQSLGLPGLALAVTNREKVLHLWSCGWADLKRRLPVNNATMFEIGSISKSFASIVALQLVEKGLLDLHKPVKTYLPWFEIRSKYEPITLHHLLTHTAGIPCGTECTINGYTEALELRTMHASAPPGTYFHYSNTGYKIVGLLIESILRRPPGKVIESRIMAPLGMTSSGASIQAEVRKEVAVGYAPSYDDRPAPRKGPLSESPWVESDTADGSIVSTATDMAAYVRMLLNHGKHASGRLITDKSFDLLTKKHIRWSPSKLNEWYGYGLDVREAEGHRVISHSGGMLGFVSYMTMDLDAGIGLILLVNGLTATEEMSKNVLGALRHALEGHELPKLIPSKPRNIENASDYSGIYKSLTGSGKITLISQGRNLRLSKDGRMFPLESRGTEEFFVEAPGFELFLLRFKRKDGKVTEVTHGPELFVRAGSRPSRAEKSPAIWSAYVGHYRTHNQWVSNFRIVMRNGSLFKEDPSGKESPLIHIRGSEFREGPDEQCPEVVRFDTLHDGKAMRAVLSGCPCYRTFTP